MAASVEHEAIRAAAEGAAHGAIDVATAMGELRGAVLARLDAGQERMDELRESVRDVQKRLVERDDHLATTLDRIDRELAGHEQRLQSLEGQHRTAVVWMREALGWCVAAGALIWSVWHKGP